MILTSPRLDAPRPFWQGCQSARSVVVVEVNGYTIEPGANLKGATLEWAGVDEDTTWPDGFDPEVAGVIFD